MRENIGDYEILGHWAKGARAETFVARPVAAESPDEIRSLRVLSEPDHGGALLDALAREMVLSAQFSHPQVARTHDVFMHEGRVCIVSDFVEGEPLKQLLRAEARGLPPALASWIAAEVALVIETWHGRQAARSTPSRWVHGDLSPSSIMLTYDAKIVVRDFGIALAHSRLDRERERAIGHPGYMSPERARGPWDVDARADIYSLGLVLWEMLAGAPALGAGDERALLAAAERPRVGKLSSRARCGRTLERLVSQMLSFDPDERPRTMKEVAGQLRALLEKAKGDPRAELEKHMSRRFQHRARAVRTLTARWRSRMPSALRTGDLPQVSASSGDVHWSGDLTEGPRSPSPAAERPGRGPGGAVTGDLPGGPAARGGRGVISGGRGDLHGGPVARPGRSHAGAGTGDLGPGRGARQPGGEAASMAGGAGSGDLGVARVRRSPSAEAAAGAPGGAGAAWGEDGSIPLPGTARHGRRADPAGARGSAGSIGASGSSGSSGAAGAPSGAAGGASGAAGGASGAARAASAPSGAAGGASGAAGGASGAARAASAARTGDLPRGGEASSGLPRPVRAPSGPFMVPSSAPGGRALLPRAATDRMRAPPAPRPPSRGGLGSADLDFSELVGGASRTEPERPGPRLEARRAQITPHGRRRSPVEMAARGLPSAAFSAEPALDLAATDDLIRVATSDFVPRPRRRLSFAQGVLLCWAVVAVLSISALFWPPEWRRAALALAGDLRGIVARLVLALVKLIGR